MTEEKSLSYEIVDGKIVVSLDLDKDNAPSVELKIDIMEVIKEVVKEVVAKLK